MTKRSQKRPPQLPVLHARTLHAYLRDSGVSQHDLARAAGVTQAHISQIASGEGHPSGPVALELHKLTGVPLKALLKPRRLPRRTGTA